MKQPEIGNDTATAQEIGKKTAGRALQPASPNAEGALCLDREVFDRQLEGLLEISNLVGSVMQLDDILQKIVQLTSEMLDTPTCSIYLVGPKRENLTLRAAAGVSATEVTKKKLPLGAGLPGIAAEENILIAVPDASRDERHSSVYGSGPEQQHAYVCAPLRIQEEVIGVMTARRYGGRTFSKEDCTLFETVCKQVAIVIEKSKMYFEKREADRLAAISISLSEVAHYIKNLLQSMKGGIYFVDVGLKKDDIETARKGWDVLQRGNRKIAKLVENMLNYSREQKLRLERHNINSLIYDILHQIDDSAVERKVALIPETRRDLPSVLIDYDRMYDALLNLVTNAIDAIPEGRDNGIVTVKSRLSEDGKFAEIEIRDNGVGIPPGAQEKIFNLFFSTKGDKGSGIGLSVTRKVVEAHNGRIHFESTEGQGTVFTVLVPVADEE